MLAGLGGSALVAALPRGLSPLPASVAAALRRPDSLPDPRRPAGAADPRIPIEHVVVVMMENHSFDNYFGMLPRRGLRTADGFRFDRRGNLFVTGPKGLWVWDAQGRHLGTIVLPEQPANLAWGDKDYGTLYITATTSVYRLRTKTRGFVPYLAH